VYPVKEPALSDEQWKKLHEILSSGTVEEISFNFTYEYFRKYCYLPGSRFCFNAQYVYFNGTPRYIDKVHSEESFFQQSTVHDYYDLTFDEIMLLKQIYEVIIGEFP
jgi:hypothetical protein